MRVEELGFDGEGYVQKGRVRPVDCARILCCRLLIDLLRFAFGEARRLMFSVGLEPLSRLSVRRVGEWAYVLRPMSPRR